MNNILAVSAVSICLAFTSCATTARRMPPPAPTSRIVDIQSYEIGETSSCATGEPLLQRKKFLETSMRVGIRPNRQFTIRGGIGPASASFSGTPQTVFTYYGVVAGQRAYAIPNHPHSYVFGVNKDGMFTGTVGGVTYGYSPVVGMNQYSVQPPDTRFEEVVSYSQAALPDGSYLNHEIMYSGMTATELRLLYREYTPTGMARSAFSQELVFPADAKVIRVKNYKITVHETRADGMDFEVTADS
jgi:hypothetical protein